MSAACLSHQRPLGGRRGCGARRHPEPSSISWSSQPPLVRSARFLMVWGQRVKPSFLGGESPLVETLPGPPRPPWASTPPPVALLSCAQRCRPHEGLGSSHQEAQRGLGRWRPPPRAPSFRAPPPPTLCLGSCCPHPAPTCCRLKLFPLAPLSSPRPSLLPLPTSCRFGAKEGAQTVCIPSALLGRGPAAASAGGTDGAHG